MLHALRRSFRDFLAGPSLVMAGFLLLAILAPLVERTGLAWVVSLRRTMGALVFGDPEATSSLLGTIATSLITTASITFSLLLLAVQQSAAALTSQVYDQFLRRRLNQVFFGFFVGLALYALVILATVRPDYNPVLGASLALALTGVALYFLVVLIYGAIDQARPSSVISAIHARTLEARERHAVLYGRTRRSPTTAGAGVPVRATENGFVTQVGLDALGRAAERAGGRIGIVLDVTIGAYVSFHEGDRRDQGSDARGSGGAAAGGPGGGRDLLARWSEPQERAEGEPVPVVYDDDLIGEVITALVSLAVVSSESMQHQCYTEVVRTFAMLFDRLAAQDQRRVEDAALRILSGLGDFVLTAELDQALCDLAGTLGSNGHDRAASAVRAARDELAASVGSLNSRSTRVPANGGS